MEHGKFLEIYLFIFIILFLNNFILNYHFINYSPSKQAIEQLAKDLVRQYPALGDPTLTGFGYKMWFFNSIHGRAATGFLEERLKIILKY